jgi:type I restriction enzyme S subunit
MKHINTSAKQEELMNVLLSIKPEFAEKILAGTKRYEFRRTPFREPSLIDTIVLYATAPVQRIVGKFNPAGVVADAPENLWERFRDESGIESYERFTNYFAGAETGYAIKIEQTVQFDDQIDPWRHVDDFRPPVSFQYVDGELEFVLDPA